MSVVQERLKFKKLLQIRRANLHPPRWQRGDLRCGETCSMGFEQANCRGMECNMSLNLGVIIGGWRECRLRRK